MVVNPLIGIQRLKLRQNIINHLRRRLRGINVAPQILTIVIKNRLGFIFVSFDPMLNDNLRSIVKPLFLKRTLAESPCELITIWTTQMKNRMNLNIIFQHLRLILIPWNPIE